MAIDNTHTKYLRGVDKKAWEDYKSAYESQKKLEHFFGGLDDSPIEGAKDGELVDIPVKKKNKKKQGQKQE